MSRRGTALAALSLAALAGCAPLPPPQSAPAPPQDAAPVPAPTPSAPRSLALSGEPRLSVGLHWDLDSLALALPGPTPVTSGAGSRSASGVLVAARGPDGAWSWRAGAAGGAIGGGDTLWVGDRRAFSHRPIGWNGKTWRGALKVFVNPRGRLTLASELPLESYLLGVLPGEIGPLAPALLEAGRAQAIAARSYTLFYRGRRAAEGFDVYSSVEDQVYGPVESERPLATRCVETTRAAIALFDGQPIRANYSSTCGGITSEVWEAWPAENLPYLVSHPDAEGGVAFCAQSPHYRWREEWSAAELAANLARHAPAFGVPLPPGGVGEITDVRVETRSRSGRAWRVVVETTRGRMRVPAYVMRQVLRRPGRAESILRSNLFKLEVRRDPATRAALGIVVSGGGNGHGAGLCQTGALGMARAGRRAEAIVMHYYRGVEIRRMY